MELDALIKHLEELRVCAQKCNDDGAGPIAVEAELVNPIFSQKLEHIYFRKASLTLSHACATLSKCAYYEKSESEWNLAGCSSSHFGRLQARQEGADHPASPCEAWFCCAAAHVDHMQAAHCW